MTHRRRITGRETRRATPRFLLRKAALAFAVAAGLACYASAQVNDGGPIIIGEREKPSAFHLNRPTAALELESVYRQDKSTTGSDETEFNEKYFSEFLSLETTGHVFSPAFIELNLKGDFGLTQTISTVNDDTDTSTGELLRWDLLGIYRRESFTPLSLFSQRENQWIHREFGPSLETITNNNGARFDVRWAKAPTRFEVARIETEQKGIDEGDDFTYNRDRFSWYTVCRPNLTNTVTGNYQFNRIEQEGTFDAQYDTHDFSLNHELLFGDKKRHTLTSSFDYRAQTGDFDLQSIRFAERLRLRHTDRFETYYDYRLDYYDYPQTERMRNYGQVGFLHRLFESLTTNGSVSASQSTESPNDFDSFEWQADVNLAYRKRVPLGRLFADLGLRHNVQDNSERGEDTQFNDQPATFSDPLPIVIPGANVSANTLVITDPSGLLIYEEGVDYTLSRFPDRIELNRIVGGRIPNLSTVLIDYVVLPTPGNTTTTDNLSFHLRYELDKTWFRGLGVYGRYAIQDQSIDTDRPQDFVLNGYDDLLYGIDYRRGPFTIGVEQQIHDSDVSPYEAQRAYIRYLRRLNELTLSANATFTTLDRTDDDNQTDLLTVSAQARYQVSRRMFVAATVLYRDQSDTLGSDLRGFEQQLEMQWRHRQTTVYMQARNSQLDTETDSDSFQYFQLGLRREF